MPPSRPRAAAARHPAHRGHHRRLGALPAAQLPGRGPTPWRGQVNTLTEEQQRVLTAELPAPHDAAPPGPADAALLGLLARDGRAGQAELAGATGWSPATVARRLADLRASVALFFDVEVNPAALGATTAALLWMSVVPAQLDRVAHALARHDELAFVAATTGPTNLVAQALCADPGALHRYLVTRLSALDAVRTLETAPVLRTVKSSGPLSGTGTGKAARSGRDGVVL